MHGFIVDRTYRIVDGKACVYLFGRLENGESFMTVNSFRPFFYIRASDLKKAEKLAKFEATETGMKTMAGEPVTRLTIDIPRDVPQLRSSFENAGIPCFEADIQFTMRFLMAHAVLAQLEINGEHRAGERVGRVYEEPTLTPSKEDVRLTTLSLDIETGGDGRLYAVSVTMGATRGAADDRKATLFLKDPENKHHAEFEKTKTHDIEFFDDEKLLLERLAALFREWDPDIVTGWNVIGFDLVDLKTRFDRHKVPFVLGRTEWPCTLKIEKEFFRDSSAQFPGRMVLDGIHLLKSSFISLDDYKLETAAQALIGEGKLIQEKGNKLAEIERLYREEPQALVAYNRKDTELVLRILAKRELIELTALRSAITGVTMERVRGSIASFESVYIRAMNSMKIVAPSGKTVETEERIKGGFVRESRPGIYDNILVLDFKSMYPSVMRTFNIDPLSFMPGCEEKRSSETVIVSPNGACFSNGSGLLPQIIQHVWEERDRAKKRKDAVASLAFKTLMNSFFGVLANPTCRFFSLDMANAITAFARQFIKLTAEKVEAMGYEVIYGDTDSIFVDTKASSVEEALATGKRIQDEINSFYVEYVRSEYHRQSFMEIQPEKVYRKFLMPRLRGSDEGAKKRYAGLRVIDGEEKMDFTGLEFVRRDWTDLAKEFQLELLDRIFHEREVTEYVKRFVKDVKDGKHDELLVYRKSIRKGLEGYTKTTPQHVKAARILEKKEGKLPSSIIEYVVTKAGPEPVGHLTAPVDYDHYIEKQLAPIADSVLSFYDTSFDDLIGGSKQKTLFGY